MLQYSEIQSQCTDAGGQPSILGLHLPFCGGSAGVHASSEMLTAHLTMRLRTLSFQPAAIVEAAFALMASTGPSKSSTVLTAVASSCSEGNEEALDHKSASPETRAPPKL